MTITAQRIAAFISNTYVLPARQRGEGIVIIPARQVWKELDGEFRLEMIRGILGSVRFRSNYAMLLMAQEGSTEDPSDTYVFRLLAAGSRDRGRTQE